MAKKQTSDNSNKDAADAAKGAQPPGRTTPVKQSDVPRHSLESALRVPRAILDNYAGEPSSPLRVAMALGMDKGSGSFRELCGASLAYGLTSGGPRVESIAVEPLARRILEPTKEGDDTVARRIALLKPRIVGEFLTKYNNHSIPRDEIARNVLVEMGVPRDRAEEAFSLILEGARSVGIAKDHKGKIAIDLSGFGESHSDDTSTETGGFDVDEAPEGSGPAHPPNEGGSPSRPSNGQSVAATITPDHTQNRRVFITHGKNTAFVNPIRELLRFGELEAVVSVENQSVSQPVPDKVMADMRRCGAAIIHVEAEMRLIDQEAKEHVVLNPNVLIEIGAAMALYGRRFILLVREGITLPSNLQGLYEVRYSGDALDGNATIALLKAINDIKNHATPTKGGGEPG